MMSLPSHLATTLRRCLAATALVAQVLAVAAPLVDVHPAQALASFDAELHLADGSGMPGGDQHDASRCPGCIAQLVHAAPTATARISMAEFELRAAPAAVTAGSVSGRPPSALHPRAPPARS